jgi:pimeloyl-ACP methyl ester carboxylesterase
MPLNGSMWRRQQALLPGHSHAPTLYGLGETLSDWARAVLDRVAGDRLILVGNSIGGSCAMEMAARAADRIAALVLVGAKAGHRPEPMLRTECLDLLERGGVEAGWDKYWAPLFSAGTPLDLLADAKHMATASSAAEIANGVNAFHSRADRHGLLSALHCPVLCISGEHDIAPGVATTARQAEAAPDGRLIVIPDCGHYVSLEQSDAFNAILQSLVDELA